MARHWRLERIWGLKGDWRGGRGHQLISTERVTNCQSKLSGHVRIQNAKNKRGVLNIFGLPVERKENSKNTTTVN